MKVRVHTLLYCRSLCVTFFFDLRRSKQALFVHTAFNLPTYPPTCHGLPAAQPTYLPRPTYHVVHSKFAASGRNTYLPTYLLSAASGRKTYLQYLPFVRACLDLRRSKKNLTLLYSTLQYSTVTLANPNPIFLEIYE